MISTKSGERVYKILTNFAYSYTDVFWEEKVREAGAHAWTNLILLHSKFWAHILLPLGTQKLRILPQMLR